MSVGPKLDPGMPAVSEVWRTFARIGLLSFGGPAGQISLMHRTLVEEKKWLDERRFLHALNYCMLLPGPEAMQLATYIGWLVGGTRGGLIAGLLFILPGAVVITALSAIYLVAGDLSAVAGIFFGLKAAVLAVVLDALTRIARRALKGWPQTLIAVTAFLAIALLKLPFPLVIVIAALAGAVFLPSSTIADTATHSLRRTSLGRTLATVATWTVAWFAPLAILVPWLGSGHVYVIEAGFFAKLAMVTFGGAYAVLAYVAQQAVDIHGWLRPQEMLAGLGLAETTPGPLILVLVFVGFLGGARSSGFEPLVGGIGGALVCLWFSFVPCFLWIFAGAPYLEAAGRVRWLSSAMAGVTAAVVGVIANLALWFGLHVFFGAVGAIRHGPIALPLVDWTTLDLRACAIAAAAIVALIGGRVNLLAVLATAMVAGVLINAF